MQGNPDMTFIESIFGLSPDGGDGSTELGYFLAITLILASLSLPYLLKRFR
jgi:hypothetical protein